MSILLSALKKKKDQYLPQITANNLLTFDLQSNESRQKRITDHMFHLIQKILFGLVFFLY